MKKTSTKLSVLVIFFLLVCNAVGVVSAQQSIDSALQLALISAELESATHQELISRAQYLHVDSTGSIEQLRQRLYAWYDLVPVEPVSLIEEKSAPLTVEIITADRVYLQGSTAQFILLEGQVQLAFSDATSAEQTTISAHRVVIDTKNELLTAMGAVHYQRRDEGAKDILDGAILTLRWASGNLVLSEGELYLSRDNSEGDPIDFYTTGAEVFFSGTPRTIAFSDGFITTNKEQAYFSIGAKNLYVNDGGDLFVTKATISLGRVPLLWVPFLYYPGKTFIFNPVLGFESNRGFFFSSTTEIFGKYPKIVSEDDASFTALLATKNNAAQVKDGWVYSDAQSQKEISAVEKWAQESTSYLSLLFDAYQNLGLLLGFDSALHFAQKKYSLVTFGALAFLGDQVPVVSSSYLIAPLRYAFQVDFKIATKVVNLSMQLPFYSDPRFMRDYGNRLTSFSLGALLGDGKFPTTYRSDLPSFTWKFTSSITIPTTLLNPIVESLRIETLSFSINWRANSITEGTGYSIAKVELPTLGVYLAGTLFKFDQGATNPPPQKESEVVLDPAIKLADYGIESPYVPAGKQKSSTLPKITSSSVSLGYEVRQNFNNSTTYQEAQVSAFSRYARTAGALNFKVALAPSLLRLTQTITPLLAINESSKSATENISFTSSTDVELVSMGLSYHLTMRLFNQSKIREETGTTISGGWGKWDSQSVSRHQVSWHKAFTWNRATLTPSMNVTLAPLRYGFQPKIAFAQGKYSVSASYRLQEDASGNFVGDKASVAFSYSDPKHLLVAASATYDTRLAQSSSFWWQPLDVATAVTGYLGKNGYLKLAEKSNYSFKNKEFKDFQLSASLPWASLSVQGSGPVNEPVVNIMDGELSLARFEKLWWKNRISLGFDLAASYRHAFWDTAASNFSFKLNLRFGIAEFVTLDIALTTVNRGFHRYTTVAEMWEDFLRSCDFIGEGRRNTQFTMEAVEVSLIHHMADWDLHCKYEGSIVLSDMEWRWNPVFSVFLKWKAIPEIKVDRRFVLDP